MGEMEEAQDLSQLTGRKKKLFELRLKMNKARKQNHSAVVAEKKRQEVPTKEDANIAKKKRYEAAVEQKTAYEIRPRDWSSDVCSSDLRARWVTLRARWVTLRARWVTLRAHWVTLRALWVTAAEAYQRVQLGALGQMHQRHLTHAAYARDAQHLQPRAAVQQRTHAVVAHLGAAGKLQHTPADHS